MSEQEVINNALEPFYKGHAICPLLRGCHLMNIPMVCDLCSKVVHSGRAFYCRFHCNQYHNTMKCVKLPHLVVSVKVAFAVRLSGGCSGGIMSCRVRGFVLSGHSSLHNSISTTTPIHNRSNQEKLHSSLASAFTIFSL